MRNFALVAPVAGVLLLAACSVVDRTYSTGGTGGKGTTTGSATTSGPGTSGSGGTMSTTGPGGAGGTTSSAGGSPASTSSSTSTSSGCVPKTCLELGAQCGNPDNGCGTPLDCGFCTAGEVCGATSPNQCGTSAECASYASNICNTYQACAPDVVTAEYGSVSACQTRFALLCSLFVSEPQDAWTPAQAQSCGSALATLGSSSCESFLLAFFGAPPAACKPPSGPRSDGTDCIDAGQCASGYCKHSAGSWCGACATPSGSGGSCTTYLDCQSGLACVSGTCTTAEQTGGPCTMGGNQCALGLYCQGATPTCQPPLQLNDACTFGSSTCDPLKNLYCNSATGTCVKFQSYAAEGQTCGISGDMIIACSAAATCTNLVTTGATCVAPAMDGQPCDPSSHVNCTNPAACVTSGSMTICQLPGPTVCQ